MLTDSYSSLGLHGFHRIAYTDWGAFDNDHVVVGVHGLTRNSRDFDFLAGVLAADCRVVCPDMAGRGASDWLPVKQDYGYPLYLADSAALLARVSARQPAPADAAPALEKRIDWVGTSMGGLIGMMLAALPNAPIRRLVVNDIGAFIPKEALARIGAYVGVDSLFDTMEALENDLRVICAPFGPLTDAQWRHLAEHGSRRRPDGRIGYRYDPGIAAGFKGVEFKDIDLWALWDNIKCPTLLIRGAESDLLPAATAKAMLERGPRSELVEFPAIGHAPMLMEDEQIAKIRDFLLRP